jgi:hypothetical protein
MPGVVIVGVSVDFEIPRNELPEQRGPVPQVVCSVDDCFVPRRCQTLDAFAVAQPSDVNEISRYQIESIFHFPRSGHITVFGCVWHGDFDKFNSRWKKLKSIRIQRFKRISDASLDLENVNVLVGGISVLKGKRAIDR